MKKLIRIFFMAAIAASLSSPILASGKSYVAGAPKIADIEDSDREAEAWAMCAASYDLMAWMLDETNPAKAKQLTERANGAELAVTISMVTSELDEDTTPEKFKRLWEFSKLIGNALPTTMNTSLLADLESDDSEGKDVFIESLSKTVAVCIDNLAGQQMYIDIWRSLAKSGMLK